MKKKMLTTTTLSPYLSSLTLGDAVAASVSREQRLGPVWVRGRVTPPLGKPAPCSSTPSPRLTPAPSLSSSPLLPPSPLPASLPLSQRVSSAPAPAEKPGGSTGVAAASARNALARAPRSHVARAAAPAAPGPRYVPRARPG